MTKIIRSLRFARGLMLVCGACLWLAPFAFITSAQAATFNWTTGTTGDASGAWSGAASTFNGQAYTAADTLVINGSATKTVTTTGTITAPTLLTVSGTGTSGATTSGASPNIVGVPGVGAITLTGTSVGGTLSKTGTADMVLATANAFGTVTISGGKFFLNNAAGLGTTGTLNVNSGAASGVTGSYAAASMASFFYDSTNISGDYAFSKNITFGAVGSATTYGMAQRGGAATTTTLSGAITGASNVTLWHDTSTGGDGLPTWSLAGNNSGFAGTIRMNRGRLVLGTATSGGTGTIFLQTPTNASAGNLAFGAGVTSVSTNLTIGTTVGEFINTGAANVTLSGAVSSGTANSGGFSKMGSGTLFLTGSAATYAPAATAISAGTLDVSSITNGAFATGALSGAGNLTFGTKALTLNHGATDTTFSGALTGSGAITKSGTGILSLTGNNTNFTGGVTVTAADAAATGDGVFKVTGQSALGTGPVTAGLNANYGTAYASGGNAFLFINNTAAVTLSNDIVISAGDGTTRYYNLMKDAATSSTGTNLTLNGVISGGGANTILQLDSDTGSDNTTNFTLTGNNTIAGQVRLNRGYLNLAHANALGTAKLFLQTNANATAGNLNFVGITGISNDVIIGTNANQWINTGAATITLSGVLSSGTAGSGSWGKMGTGTLVLSGANAYNGAGTTIADGTLSITGSGRLHSAAYTGTLGLTAATSVFDYASSTDQAISGAISGAGKITKSGSSVLTLSGNNSYLGGTTISDGTVAVGHNSALGTGGVTVAATAAYGATYVSGGTPFLRTSAVALNVANDITLPNAAGYYALQMGATEGSTVTWSGKLSGGGAGVVLQIDTPHGGDSTSMATLSNPANDIQGAIRLNRGRLALSNATAAGSADILLRTNVNAAGNLIFNFSGNFANNIATVDAAGQVISTGANNVNLTGILGGPSSWVKTGTGTLTLSNANTISGGTSITGGTLNLAHSLALQNSTLTTGGGAVLFDQSVASHAFTLGGLAGAGNLALQDNAGSPNAVALTVGNNSTDTVYSGALSGAGSLIKVGTGELTLSSASTYSGGTTINTGSVNLGNSAALGTGGVTVASTAQYGATYVSEGTPFLRTTVTGLNVANDITLPGTAGYYALQSGAAAGSTVTWSGKISGGGAGVVLQIDTANAGDGTTMATLSSATSDFQGQIRLNRGRLTLTNPNAAGSAAIFLQTNANASGNLLFSGPMTVANAVTLGTTANQAISTASGDVTLSGVVGNNAGNLTGSINKVGANSLTLTNSANALTGPTTVTAGTLAIGGAGQFNSSGTYAGNVSIAAAATLRYSSSANQTLSGLISSTGALIKDTSSTSTLTLTADNSFSGITTINGGTLALADGSGTLYETGAFFGGVGTSYVNINTGGTFKTWDWTHGAAFALSQLRSNYYAVNLNGGTIQFDDTFAASRAFQVGPNGGTLEVTTGNTYTKQAGTTGSENIIRFTANSTLTLAGAGNGVIQDALGAYGSTGFAITKNGSGTWTLSGANSHTGVTTVNAGTLLITNSSGLGTTAGGADVNSGATLQLGNVAIGAEALTLEGAGATSLGALLVDNNVASYAGAITLEASSTIGVRNNSTLTLSGGINKNGFNVTFLGTGAATNTANINTVGISGVADVIVDNMTVNLNAANSYVGPTTIQNGGILNANVADALPTGTFSAVSIDASSRLNLNGGFPQTAASLSGAGTVDNTQAGANTLTISPTAGSTNFSGAITNSAGTLSVVKNGAGTQELSGANTYSGSTTVNAGTLLLSAGGLENSNVAVTGGTFLQTAGTNNVTGPSGDLTITGGGQYRLQGGTLNFGDYAAGGTAWNPADESTITTPTGAQFEFSGGSLVDVSNIVVGDGSAFTQSGGDFYVGRIGAGPAAETTIDGGFSLLGGVLRLDVFGSDPTPEACCDGEPSNNDQLSVTGAALLDSAVALNFVGYDPEFGDAFTLICAEEITLDEGFFISNGFYRIVPSGDAEFPFALQAIVPEPASVAVWSLVCGAGLALARVCRRKRK